MKNFDDFTCMQYSINHGTSNDFAYVHIMRNGAKVCLHFPTIRIGEKVERYNTYYEAEQAALKINAARNMIDEKDIVLATVDTSVYSLDDSNLKGVMTGAFVIKNSEGEILEEVIYQPEDNIVSASVNLGLTDVAEIKTVIYMLNYMREKGYTNILINHDNKRVKEVQYFDNKVLTRVELNLANDMRKAIWSMNGEIIFQHLKSHTGHKTLDYVDALAKNANKKHYQRIRTLKETTY